MAALLSAIRRDLDAVIAPEIASPAAREAAAMMSELLAYLTVWQRDLPGQVEPLTRAQAEALARLRGPDPATPAATGDAALTSDIAGSLPDYEGLLRALDAELAALDGDGGRETAISQAVGADLLLFDREASLLGSERERAPIRLADSLTPLSETRLTAYARDVFPADAGASVSQIMAVPRAHCRETSQILLTSGIGRAREMLLRRDYPFTPPGMSVSGEFAVLRILHQAGFPVLEPLWCETEAAPLGQPFMLSAALPPDADPRWSEADDDDSRAEACLGLARILGRLHTLDERVLAAAGLSPSGDPRQEIRTTVETWRDRWLALRTHPSPTLQAAFLWLLDHAPPGIARTSLLHGDLAAGSLAVDGTRIAALLDWEFAHLGDPAEDLAACRPWVEPLVAWPEFLRAYRSAGGHDPDPASSAYYAIWRGVRNAVCCCIAWRGFTSGVYPALDMAYRGIPLYRRHVRDTAERLRREWARQDT